MTDWVEVSAPFETQWSTQDCGETSRYYRGLSLRDSMEFNEEGEATAQADEGPFTSLLSFL